MGIITAAIKCCVFIGAIIYFTNKEEKPLENQRKNKKGERMSEEIHAKESPRVKIRNVEKRKERVIKIVVAEPERRISHYSSSQKMLLVGEGDFSFSASLAMAFGSASNMIATSLDSIEFLWNNYQNAISNINKLQIRGCRVMHGADATQMAKNPLLYGMKFDCIIYNFPFAGFFKSESRKSQISRHQRLVNLFLENAKEMISKVGEIHITHKTNGFHREWNIELLASHQGLRLIEAVHFDQTDFPGYSTKCGFGGDNDFDCNPSKTYKFGLLAYKM